MTVKGYVVNANDGTVIPNVLIVVKTDTGNISSVSSDKDGNFSFTLDRSKFKNVEFYTQTNKETRTPTAPQGFLASELKYKISSGDSIKKNYIFELRQIYSCGPPPSVLFKYNSTAFADSLPVRDFFTGKITYSKPANEVDLIYQMLIDNPTVIIELSGHCSSNETKGRLSQKRAQLVKQMLVAKGIDSVRISERGWGIVKLKVTDEQIKKAKTKEEKEALNQMNRRVVVKIISWDYPAKEQPKYKPRIREEEDIDKIPGK